jgi:hypothetical protein
MNDYDMQASMEAFAKLCDEAERSELIAAEECQYWLFERGYVAAMKEMMRVIQEGKTEQLPLPNPASTPARLALH